MSNLVKPPSCGDLKPLLFEGDALAAEKDRAATLLKIVIASGEVDDLIINGRLT